MVAEGRQVPGTVHNTFRSRRWPGKSANPNLRQLWLFVLDLVNTASGWTLFKPAGRGRSPGRGR